MSYDDDNVKHTFFKQSKVCNSKIMIPSVQFSNVLSFHACLPYLHVSGKSDHNWMSYTDDKIKQGLIQQSRGYISKVNYNMTSFQTCPIFHKCPSYLQVSGASDQNWRSYGDDKHLSIVSLWEFVVAIATKVFIGFPWKANVIHAPPEACYRWEMLKISLKIVET